MCSLSLVPVQTAETPGPARNDLPPAVILATDHLRWARAIARGVRRSFNFGLGSQEEQDLQSAAYLAVVDLVRRFDFARVPPSGDARAAFRGWAAIEVRSRCRREARRLRNGGTYYTRRERPGQALIVGSLQNQPALIDPRSEKRELESEDESASEAPLEVASLE